MKILVTGSSGMLGGAVCEELSDRYEVVGLDIRRNQKPEYRNQKFNFIETDITQRNEAIERIIRERPDIIIHAAAYTDVDGSEQNPEKAQKVNAQGTETTALACQHCGALLYYISTDFVFDGEKKSAYTESDQPHPINIYGKSKLDGERYVQSILKEFVIIRSSWLFGKGGTNFVDNILQKAKTEKEIKVVDDQFGPPTYARDLAEAIAKLIALSDRINGFYHITNSGSCSWYEFALAITEAADLAVNIVPISSEKYHSPTRRPKMSILDNRRYQEVTGMKLRHWKEVLQEYLAEVKDGCTRIKR